MMISDAGLDHHLEIYCPILCERIISQWWDFSSPLSYEEGPIFIGGDENQF